MRGPTRWITACLAAALWTGCKTTAGEASTVESGFEPDATETAQDVDPTAQMGAWMAMNQPGEQRALLDRWWARSRRT